MNTVAREINDKTIGIEFPKGLTAFGKTVLEKQDNLQELTNLVSTACGRDMQIKYIEPEPEEIITKTSSSPFETGTLKALFTSSFMSPLSPSFLLTVSLSETPMPICSKIL